MRAKLGMKKVRPWKWMPFTNPARKDNLVLHHWRRQVDEGKDYPFARFNKTIEVPTYTEVEYQHHLVTSGWSRQETDHLMDLAQRFDLRFIVMQDRWDRNSFSPRSVEDLKERYYSILEKLERVHGGATGEQVTTFLRIPNFNIIVHQFASNFKLDSLLSCFKFSNKTFFSLPLIVFRQMS